MKIVLFFVWTLVSSSVVFKKTELDSPVLSLDYCGPQNSVLLAITENNSLYRSTDEGASWSDMTKSVTEAASTLSSSKVIKVGKVAKIVKSPPNNSLVVFLGTEGFSWLSHSCGEDFRVINHGRKISEFIFHPYESSWALCSAYSICEDYVEEPCKINKEIFFTDNYGEDWQYLTSYVVQFGWGVFSKYHELTGVPKTRVLVTQDMYGKKNQQIHGWSYKVDFVISDNFFKNRKLVLSKGNKFILTFDFIFVAQLAEQETQEVVLHKANSKKKEYSFTKVNLPFGHLTEHSYTFLDTAEKSLFLGVNHLGTKSRLAHIYVSDNEGDNFTLSLRNNVTTVHGHSEFERYSQIHGVYVANSVEDKFIKEIAPLLQGYYERDSMEEGIDTENIEKQMDKKVQTHITFNKGGSWHRLRPPKVLRNGAKVTCEECFLNLHGVSGSFNPFYTVENAIGLMVGIGNIGEYLDHNPSNQSVFLSRDGGNEWNHIMDGEFIYEIGDHGGIIALVSDAKPTNIVHLSFDEGLSWVEERFSEEEVRVDNIVLDPASAGSSFIILGKSEDKGVTFKLEFPSIRACSTEGNSSDYENWIPSNYNENNCILGLKRTYQRRKRENKCLNGKNFDRLITSFYCECTREDYTCDTGFYLDSDGDKCFPENPNQHENIEAPLICESSYRVSLGYRKVPGSYCINGNKYDAIYIPCPYSTLFTVVKVFLIFLLLIGVVFLAIATKNKLETHYASSQNTPVQLTGEESNTLFD